MVKVPIIVKKRWRYFAIKTNKYITWDDFIKAFCELFGKETIFKSGIQKKIERKNIIIGKIDNRFLNKVWIALSYLKVLKGSRANDVSIIGIAGTIKSLLNKIKSKQK